MMAGAVIGNQAEAANTLPATAMVRTCATTTSYENRLVGYDVVYEYQGQRYSTRVASLLPLCQISFTTE